jgi:hypothetical protein
VLAVVVNRERVSAENDVLAFLPIDDEVPNRRSLCVGPSCKGAGAGGSAGAGAFRLASHSPTKLGCPPVAEVIREFTREVGVGVAVGFAVGVAVVGGGGGCGPFRSWP